MEIFNAIIGVLGAIGTFLTAFFMWRQIISRRPSVSVSVSNIPGYEIDGSNARSLQQNGFYILNIVVYDIPHTWSFHALEIRGAKVPSVIVDDFGRWVGDRGHEHMVYGKNRFLWALSSRNEGDSFPLLFQPDLSERGTLILELRGPLLSRVRVPFSYEKTRFFEFDPAGLQIPFASTKKGGMSGTRRTSGRR